MADEPAVFRLRDRIAAERGRLDVLINNAGGWRYEKIREVTHGELGLDDPRQSAEHVHRIARVHGHDDRAATTDASSMCLPLMRYRPKPTLPVYAAAKAALVSLTRTFAEELAPHQVLVNAVAPGAMATETAKSQSWLAQRIPTIPVRRAAEPEDIGEADAVPGVGGQSLCRRASA